MERKLSMVIPKGRIFDNVISLLREAGVDIRPNARHYVPYVGNPDIQAKIMKPQNIPQLIELGWLQNINRYLLTFFRERVLILFSFEPMALPKPFHLKTRI